jgi:hypothetical protein
MADTSNYTAPEYDRFRDSGFVLMLSLVPPRVYALQTDNYQFLLGRGLFIVSDF